MIDKYIILQRRFQFNQKAVKRAFRGDLRALSLTKKNLIGRHLNNFQGLNHVAFIVLQWPNSSQKISEVEPGDSNANWEEKSSIKGVRLYTKKLNKSEKYSKLALTLLRYAAIFRLCPL